MRALAAALILCACGTSARQQLVTIGEFANEARGILQNFDTAYQDRIVAEIPDKTQAQAKITAYRAQRAKVALAITELQSLVAAGKPLLQMVDDGLKGSSDWSEYMTNLLQLFEQVRVALQNLGVKL